MKRSTVMCLASALAGGLIALVLASGYFDPVVGGVPAMAQDVALGPTAEKPAPVTLTPEEEANIRVYETAIKSVVNITTSTVEYDRFFGVEHRGRGSGSGSILDRRGHVLTNNHVVEDAQSIQVTLWGGETYEAELVGADGEYDIAVLRIDAPAEQLVPLKMGRSDTLRVGQKAYAVGNPFGLEGTLTIGIVSSLNRAIPSRVNERSMMAIQTDAAMNPGNSGGPLLDSSARMIGMNVAIASSTGQNSGVGFAIPVDRVRRFVPQLIEYGRVIRADHGIVDMMATSDGLVIARLREDGPADRAGLRGFRIIQRVRRQGPIRYVDRRIDRSYADTIVAIDGQPVRERREFDEIMDRHSPGDEVTFEILREGRRQEVTVELGAA